MARVKKSRKVGQIGTPSVAKESRKQTSTPTTKNKKTKGNKSGSRNNIAETDSNHSGARASTDPRLGSKKPIPLVVDSTTTKQSKPKPAFFSPKQELQSIEDDQKLSNLLDQIDEGTKLDAEQQAYVDAKLTRHKTLCDLLGMSDVDDNESDPNEDDLLKQFDAIDINKLK